ncbi:hypothetical protein HanIR_Chr16g0829281 [Helianthus annuus]|nr:hypothetical protein HanIR_Chr16g0829281 [Helianthus annuus]
MVESFYHFTNGIPEGTLLANSSYSPKNCLKKYFHTVFFYEKSSKQLRKRNS